VQNRYIPVRLHTDVLISIRTEDLLAELSRREIRPALLETSFMVEELTKRGYIVNVVSKACKMSPDFELTENILLYKGATYYIGAKTSLMLEILSRHYPKYLSGVELDLRIYSADYSLAANQRRNLVSRLLRLVPGIMHTVYISHRASYRLNV